MPENLKSEFDLLLKNVSKYFPFSQLEQDKQDDKIIENEIDSYQQGNHSHETSLLLAFGYNKEEILKTYPGEEDEVLKILNTLGAEKC